MPETRTEDEVVSVRTNTRAGGGLSARPSESESVGKAGGPAKIERSGIEEENHGEGGRRSRVLKESTAKLLEKFEQEERDAIAPHEEGDPDEDEGAEAAEGGDAGADDGDGEADDAGVDAGADEGDASADEDADAGRADGAAELRAGYARLEAHNRQLIAALDDARKTPKNQRTERETALLAAEAAYFDAGSVDALRKFLSVITGAAPDSKEVDAELTGLYADLTEREVGVPLDHSQRALRDNARTRLLLARDKREKAEAEKKPAVDNSAEAVQYTDAAKYVDNLLGTKGQSGTSLADEYPLLMELAQDFDSYAPSEVVARAIRQEIMTGTLDPKTTSDADMVRIVAQKIEKHYDGVAQRIEAARAKKTKKPDTTPSAKPKAAVEPSKEQRQSHGARTITNAAASKAPAKPPKATEQKPKTTTEKSRKDFPSDEAWKQHLLDKHGFKS